MKRRNFVVSSASTFSSLFLYGLPLMAKDRAHFEKENGAAKKRYWLASEFALMSIRGNLMPGIKIMINKKQYPFYFLYTNNLKYHSKTYKNYINDVEDKNINRSLYCTYGIQG